MNNNNTHAGTPLITALEVIPVAGHDSLLLNLSGGHAPFFTRNPVSYTHLRAHET
mgnify:CR=1 FL=1